VKSQTLGDVLRQRVLDEKANNAAALQRRTDEEGIAEQKRVQHIEAFFEDYKQKVIAAIQGGKKLPEVVIGHEWNKGTSHQEIYDAFNLLQQGSLAQVSASQPHNYVVPPKHKYFLWKVLADWAHSEGLTVFLNYTWDGGGMSSWYILKVGLLTKV
jgi:hypothetical protein